MEILTGVERRRRWSSEEKLQILREASAPGSSVGAVARRHDISRSQIYQWRRAFRSGRLRSESFAVVDFLPVEVCDGDNEEPPSTDETPSPASMISIELRHGRTLRFPSNLPFHEIRHLVAAVEQA
ncbi:MAG: transposase [Rhodospirillales bacterium]|nr:transposase [Rhodospirillales bacterium]